VGGFGLTGQRAVGILTHMTDQLGRSAPEPTDRATWLHELRRENERQEDALVEVYDAEWGEIEDDHRAFIVRFLGQLPPGGRVLDAPCGTGKYFGMVLETGRSVLGVDQSGGYLARAATRYPGVRTEKLDIQDLTYRDAFDGVMCVDAMEFIPPEDWPLVLDRFREALHAEGWLYLTVELADPGAVREANAALRARALPVVDGEVMWEEPIGYYHHYPTLDRVRAWIAEAGFLIVDEAEGPWHDGDYAYHHVLAHRQPVPEEGSG
jgi:SAM-dependent methyltransferase